MGKPEQGGVGLLDDEAAQALLSSTVPAHLAYTWTDGTPRNTPIWFHWDGAGLVMCSPSNAPKVGVLSTGAPVAVTIHGAEWPFAVLLLRGTVVGRPRRRRRARVPGVRDSVLRSGAGRRLVRLTAGRPHDGTLPAGAVVGRSARLRRDAPAAQRPRRLIHLAIHEALRQRVRRVARVATRSVPPVSAV